jgi:hypothetical protein
MNELKKLSTEQAKYARCLNLVNKIIERSNVTIVYTGDSKYADNDLLSMEADLLDNFETIRILVATLGFPVFDQIANPNKKDILICKGKEALAEGEYTEDGLIIFQGSTSCAIGAN